MLLVFSRFVGIIHYGQRLNIIRMCVRAISVQNVHIRCLCLGSRFLAFKVRLVMEPPADTVCVFFAHSGFVPLYKSVRTQVSQSLQSRIEMFPGWSCHQATCGSWMCSPLLVTKDLSTMSARASLHLRRPCSQFSSHIALMHPLLQMSIHVTDPSPVTHIHSRRCVSRSDD